MVARKKAVADESDLTKAILTFPVEMEDSIIADLLALRAKVGGSKVLDIDIRTHQVMVEDAPAVTPRAGGRVMRRAAKVVSRHTIRQSVGRNLVVYEPTRQAARIEVTPRQEEVLQYILRHPGSSCADVEVGLKIGRKAAESAIWGLKDAGAIVPVPVEAAAADRGR